MASLKNKRKIDTLESESPHEFETDEYTCKFCLKKFSRKDHCKTHIQIVHTKEKKLKKFNCAVCDKTFYSAENLRKHVLSHSEKEIFSCPQCTKEFKSHSSLMRHIKAKDHIYPSAKEYPEYKEITAPHAMNVQCDICHRIVGRLDHHKKTYHSKESRTFSCERCEFTTDRKDTLTKHERLKHKAVNRAFQNLDKNLDPNNPKWTCFDCKKTFTSMIEIEDHMLLKSCEDTNSCKVCGKKFTVRHNLLQHVRDVHENRQTFTCSHCDKSYSQKSSLTKHLKKCNK